MDTRGDNKSDSGSLRRGSISPSTISTVSSEAPLVRASSGASRGRRAIEPTSIAAAQLEFQQRQQQQVDGLAAAHAKRPSDASRGWLKGAPKSAKSTAADSQAAKPVEPQPQQLKQQQQQKQAQHSFAHDFGKSIAFKAYRFWSLDKLRYLNLACLLMIIVCLATILVLSGGGGGVARRSQSGAPPAESLDALDSQPLTAGAATDSSNQANSTASLAFDDGFDTTSGAAEPTDKPAAAAPATTTTAPVWSPAEPAGRSMVIRRSQGPDGAATIVISSNFATRGDLVGEPAGLPLLLERLLPAILRAPSYPGEPAARRQQRPFEPSPFGLPFAPLFGLSGRRVFARPALGDAPSDEPAANSSAAKLARPSSMIFVSSPDDSPMLSAFMAPPPPLVHMVRLAPPMLADDAPQVSFLSPLLRSLLAAGKQPHANATGDDAADNQDEEGRWDDHQASGQQQRQLAARQDLGPFERLLRGRELDAGAEQQVSRRDDHEAPPAGGLADLLAALSRRPPPSSSVEAADSSRQARAGSLLDSLEDALDDDETGAELLAAPTKSPPQQLALWAPPRVRVGQMRIRVRAPEGRSFALASPLASELTSAADQPPAELGNINNIRAKSLFTSPDSPLFGFPANIRRLDDKASEPVASVRQPRAFAYRSNHQLAGPFAPPPPPANKHQKEPRRALDEQPEPRAAAPAAASLVMGRRLDDGPAFMAVANE